MADNKTSDASSGAEASQPDRIGRYEITGTLGRGGMGVVYSAVAPGGEVVALKRLDPKLIGSGEDWLQRFEREAHIRLDHPNVVRVLDAGVDQEKVPFIVLELLKGEPLQDTLKGNRRLAPARARDIALQACRGLEIIHAAGIVHRDIKPGNLFLSEDGTVKLLDFGVALKLDTERLTRTEGAAIGTPAYLSPEQARGDRSVDERTDLWAIGVILYRMLSGRRPFTGDSPLTTMLALSVAEPRPLNSLGLGIPDALCDIVHRCLQKVPHKRWPTALELANALEALDLSAHERLQVVAADDDSEALETSIQPTLTGHEQSVSIAWKTSTKQEKRVVAVVLAIGARELAPVQSAIEEQGGVLVPILGARAIGLFGGARWEGDEAARAASAALALRKSVVAVAVATGRASLSDYGVSGGAVMTAERGCARRLAGVAIDAGTASMLDDRFETNAASDGEPELLRLNPFVSSGSTRPHAIGSTVGFDIERAGIQRAAETAFGEDATSHILIVGGSGSGKSRLMTETEQMLPVLASEHEEPLLSLYAQAQSLGKNQALSLVAQVIRAWVRRFATRTEDDVFHEVDIGSIRMLVANVFGEECRDEDLSTESERYVAYLASLLGVESEESDTLQGGLVDGPRQVADQLRLAALELLSHACERGPVGLLLEDLQWADDASLSLLGHLIQNSEHLALFVCMSSRPESETHITEIFSDCDLQRVQIRGLSSAEVRLLAEAVAERPLGAVLCRTLHQHTGGNPLFIEQIVAELRHQGVLDQGEVDIPLPLTVEAAVQSRLDHLSDEERELCKRAALIGGPFRVEELAELGVGEAESLLGSLRKSGLVSSRAGAPGARQREYSLRSPLIAEVAYRMLPDGSLRVLHTQRASVLDQRKERDPERIARHYNLGGQPTLAADRYLEATLDASRRGDGHTVVRCGQLALELGIAAEDRFSVHYALADAHRFLGQHDAQLSALTEALEYADAPADKARALCGKSAWLVRRGRAKDAIAFAVEAVEEAGQTDEESTLPLAWIRRAEAEVYAGQLEDAKSSLDAARRTVNEQSLALRAAIADVQGQLASQSGDLGVRRVAFGQAVELYNKADDLRRAANAEINLADSNNRVGNYSEAEASLRTAQLQCHRVGNQLAEGYAALNLAYALIGLERYPEAVQCLADADRLADRSSDARLGVFVGIYRGRAFLGEGNLDEALKAAAVAAEQARELEMNGACALARVVAAQTHLRRNESDLAFKHASEALKIRDELRSVEEDEAEVFLAYARAAQAAGHADDALAVAQRGRSWLEGMAAKIDDPDVRKAFLHQIPMHRDLLELAR